mgnify:CR=1 FL=1
MVSAAWPYINYTPHLGTIICILSADIVARYLRLRGHDVVFVSGSDEHGTPIEVEAVRRGIAPKELTDRNHELVVDLFRRWGFSFDCYLRTEHPTHVKFIHDFYMKVYENGYIFTKEEELPYCEKCQRFLPDRFVEGVCPYCGYENARGDQCEKCGRLLEPTDLIEPRCAICGSTPVIKRTTHWFFDLSKFTEKVKEYVEGNRQFSEPVRRFSLRMLEEGLKPRAITRDNKWGIPAPFPGAEGKTIYCWFEAVLGYISATIEYFKRQGREQEWRKFWFGGDARTIYFIGKDNIPFHAILLPALLLGTHENYNLPWNVVSNEFLLHEGQKFSKSRRVGVWIDEALKMYPADYWRYVLTSIRPERHDVSFTWRLFREKVNSDLNDTLGNFVHRTLTFINKYFSGVVPEHGEMDEKDRELLAFIEKSMDEVAERIEAFRLQEALMGVIELAREGNRYLNEKEPWRTIEVDRKSAATTLYVAVQVVKALAILMAPFLPHTAEELWKMLNLSGSVHSHLWEEAKEHLPPGHSVKTPRPLFKKIDKSEEELREMLDRLRKEA